MIDKIGYTRPTSPAARAAQAKKASAAQGSDFASALASAESSGDVTATENLSALAQTQGIGSLLGVQEVTEEELHRRNAAKRGRFALEALEQLRDALLTGRLPTSTLKQLEDMVARERQLTYDPRLNYVLDEIDVRVAVELAKLEMSGYRT